MSPTQPDPASPPPPDRSVIVAPAAATAEAHAAPASAHQASPAADQGGQRPGAAPPSSPAAPVRPWLLIGGCAICLIGGLGIGLGVEAFGARGGHAPAQADTGAASATAAPAESGGDAGAPAATGDTGADQADGPPSDAMTVTAAIATMRHLERTQTYEGEFLPYQHVDLAAGVAGFVKQINVDFGDRVTQGEVLAILDVPELPQNVAHAAAQLLFARSEVERMAAEAQSQHRTTTRLLAVAKAQPQLVAQEDLDISTAKDRAAAASLAAARNQVAAARAELERLQAMQGYCTITAPFSGVITHRYADPGAAVRGGLALSAPALPLVTLSENQLLRFIFPVNDAEVDAIHLGEEATIAVQSTGTSVRGRITRYTRRIDMQTRTMDVEIDIPNDDLALIPGMLGHVSMVLEAATGPCIPLEAVERSGNHASVMVIAGDGTTDRREVVLGIATADEVIVRSGLQAGEQVMIGDRSLLVPHQKVRVGHIATSPEPQAAADPGGSGGSPGTTAPSGAAMTSGAPGNGDGGATSSSTTGKAASP
jgi:RND family efflux transporter MFP subunit